MAAKKKGGKVEQNRTERHKKAMLIALESTLGIVTTACKKCGVGRTQYYTWLQEDETFAKAVKGLQEIAVDFGESQLHQLMKDKNPASVIFFLKTKAKHRGYVERTEHVHKESDHFHAMDAMSDEEIKQEIERLRAKGDD